MISVDEARARILAGLKPVAAETVALADAWGRVLAAPVLARRMQPPADVSAMDGWAVRTEDAVAGATLTIAGEAPAGHPFAGQVGAGQTVRIFTGSVVPDGATAVVMQEDTSRTDNMVTFNMAAQQGRHIRRAGQDFAVGDAVLSAGKQLSARDIGLAAAADHPWLAVHRAPRIAILATGDEIALPGEPVPAGGIISSNSHALAALVRAAGGVPTVLPIARDDLEAIAAASDAAAGFDLLVTTGGASVGDHDLVQKALALRGLELDFWKIAMRPGKPLIHGRLHTPMGAVPLIGLPGNPVSAIVCAVLYLVPAIKRLSGQTDTSIPTSRAVLDMPVRANDGRMDFMRATLSTDDTGRVLVSPFQVQDSAMMSTLARADALLTRPPHAPMGELGDEVEIIRLADLGA